MAKANPFNPDCPSQDILALIGSKWSMLLLCVLEQRPGAHWRARAPRGRHLAEDAHTDSA